VLCQGCFCLSVACCGRQHDANHHLPLRPELFADMPPPPVQSFKCRRYTACLMPVQPRTEPYNDKLHCQCVAEGHFQLNAFASPYFLDPFYSVERVHASADCCLLSASLVPFLSVSLGRFFNCRISLPRMYSAEFFCLL